MKRIQVAEGARIACVSDIHGNIDVFRALLEKLAYSDRDVLVLLGDMYAKGPMPMQTLRFILELQRHGEVHALRGNCDSIEEWMTPQERAWVEALPHVIECEEYVFVHAGLTQAPLDQQHALSCMKNDAFMEQGLSFERQVVVGHWPTHNYTHEVPCHNPIVNRQQRIIGIDGGNVLNRDGQLNALLLSEAGIAFEAADSLPTLRVVRPQRERTGTLNITWTDRRVEVLAAGEPFSRCRHLATGMEIELPSRYIWEDLGHACARGTNHWLGVNAGDIVSVADRFEDRLLVKRQGVVGWIAADCVPE